MSELDWKETNGKNVPGPTWGGLRSNTTYVASSSANSRVVLVVIAREDAPEYFAKNDNSKLFGYIITESYDDKETTGVASYAEEGPWRYNYAGPFGVDTLDEAKKMAEKKVDEDKAFTKKFWDEKVKWSKHPDQACSRSY